MIMQVLGVREGAAAEQHKRPEREALAARFVDGLGAGLRTALSTLEPVVLRLANLGLTRKELTQLAVAKGFKQSYVRTLLSQILVRTGRRTRKSGAGPKTPALAKLILAFAREKAGAQAYKILLAAAHAARKEDQAQLASTPAFLMANEQPTAQTHPPYFIQIKPSSSLLTENPTNEHFRL
jgi:hypothetical protein